ncbi:MAG: MltA domain-containing protein [Deltaproteobacteria bacterium]|nr:MltA domain-containing protein [Deltaproteobacteria bacterium]
MLTHLLKNPSRGAARFAGSQPSYQTIILILCLLFTTSGLICLEGCQKKPRPIPPREEAGQVREEIVPAREETGLIRLDPQDYPDIQDDLDIASLSEAIDHSLAYYRRLPKDKQFTFGPDVYSAERLIRSLEYFSQVITRPRSRWPQIIKDEFLVYQSPGDKDRGGVLFTGYFEPILKGSPTKSQQYPCPIYRRPADLVVVDLSRFNHANAGQKIIGRCVGSDFMPYYSRDEIDNKGVLQGHGYELAYVTDPVDVFFLHVQGSGKIELDNGQTIRVNYDVANGRPYRSVGTLLIQENLIAKEDMSMQAIKSYLARHPEQRERILNYNPSYVFFRQVTQGPLGNLQVPVTPNRSVATDQHVFPCGALAFIQTERPLPDANHQVKEWIKFSRFVLNQDTGGAIKGPGRVDIFFGHGPEAEFSAGYEKQLGRIYFLVKKD